MARKASSSRSPQQPPARSKADLSLPAFRPVQLASLVDTMPTGNRWLHEMKYDGYRLEVAIKNGEARAYTRSGLDWSDRFTDVLAEAAGLDLRSALIDGEAVVLDVDGRSSFQSLQNALKGAPATIDYIAFDLLELNGEDLTPLPLTERKARLSALLPEGERRIRYSDHIEGGGEKLLKSFCEAGLEGVISKRADGRYVGSRSGSWLKTIYTFWDYFRHAYSRNAGLRIDHLLLSPVLAKGLVDAQVDAHVRGWEKTSDHAPVWVKLSDKPKRKREAREQPD